MWKFKDDYFRTSKNGLRHPVSGNPYPASSRKGLKAGQSCYALCPDCGEKVVISRPKSNKGYVVNTYLPKGGHVPHPCFERRNQRSKGSDNNTSDLFDPNTDEDEEIEE